MKVMIALLLVAAVIAAVWFLGPREPVGGAVAFDPEQMEEDLNAYLYRQERDVPFLRRQSQKHVLWVDPVSKAQTEYSVVYIHGFSATMEEIRPVPDMVAEALGANVFYTRLSGHGRDGLAMAEASLPDWREDMAEALEIGRRIGKKVIVISTSTGGTLTTLALAEGEPGVAGVVMVSPNYRLKAEGAFLLTWPFARSFVPLILGPERSFPPENESHARWWTTKYPTVALLPMAAAVKEAVRSDIENIDVPALFIFSDADEVVDAGTTRTVASRWGGAVSVWPVRLEEGDDRMSHVIAGRILSPSMTVPVVDRILEWINERRI